MISVISPVHKSAEQYLPAAWDSLRAQTYQDFEWILLPNRGAVIPLDIRSDEHVRIFKTEDEKDLEYNKIGRLKREASGHSNGDIIVEFDADDLLHADCLQKVFDAFQNNPDAVVVYSNAAEFEVMPPDGNYIEGVDGLNTFSKGVLSSEVWRSSFYSDYYGWKHRLIDFQGHKVNEMIAWPPSSQMMRYIFWCPNHVRAWRAKAYWQIGGHDPSFGNADDHDLMCRFYTTYGAAGFYHIDECLYFYRVHDTNSCRVWNAEIQEKTDLNYLRFSRSMAERDARDKGLKLIDLGGRIAPAPGYEIVDRRGPADHICDLDEDWPFETSSVGVIRASDVLEHLRDPIHVMNEAFRVLAPGGWFFVSVPSTDGRGAFQDPTHISFWNSNSFWYYTRAAQAQYIRPRYTGRFQMSRIIDWQPDDHCKGNNIWYTQADLICLKPPYSDRPVGEILI